MSGKAADNNSLNPQFSNSDESDQFNKYKRKNAKNRAGRNMSEYRTQEKCNQSIVLYL